MSDAAKPAGGNNGTPADNLDRPNPIPDKIGFRCNRCGLCEDAHHFGTDPPFCRKMADFSAPTYVMLDPFAPVSAAAAAAGKAPFLILGGECKMDQGGVCADCAIFHIDSWWCLDCASSKLSEFPSEVQAKINRKLTTAAKSIREQN